MTTRTIEGPLALGIPKASQDPTWEAIRRRTLELLRPLMTAKGTRRIRRLVDQAVVDYLPIKVLISVKLWAESPDSAVRDIIVDRNKATFDALRSGEEHVLSRSDKEVLLSVIKEQFDLASFLEKGLGQNEESVIALLSDGFWTLQKIDLATSAVLFVVTSELQPKFPETPHWLCLTADHYLEKWRSIVFAHDPVLQERMSQTVDELTTVPVDDIVRRLGL